MPQEERKFSLHDIQVVQYLIERCLQLYMSRSEVMSRLSDHAKIEPRFTELVWQNLEAENQEFFRAYYLRLMVKDQIQRFNQLLDEQVNLTRKIGQTEAFCTPMSNGSHIHSMHNSAYPAPESSVPFIGTEDVHQVIGTIPTVYVNGTHSMQPSMPANMMGHGGRVNVSSNIPLARSSNVGIMQGLNEGTTKLEGVYAGTSPVMFAADNNLLEPRSAIGGALNFPLNASESGREVLHGTMVDHKVNSFGFLGQMARNFGSSDLTAEFSNGIDILGYSRLSFPGMDANPFSLSIQEEQQDVQMVDTTSNRYSFKDLGRD